MVSVSPAVVAMVRIEVDLNGIIELSGVRQPSALRRLNAIENSLEAVFVPWGHQRAFVPSRDVRMATSTRDALLTWVEAEEPLAGNARTRLTAYTSGAVLDGTVQTGWIRFSSGA